MTQGESPSPGQQGLFALPPLARGALALGLVGTVAAVALLAGGGRMAPARFRAQVAAICAVAAHGLTSVPVGAAAIERRASEYAALAQRLAALRPPTIESSFYRTFVSELHIGEATWKALASDARGGRSAQLRALERSGRTWLGDPFAYAKERDLGCSVP